MFSKDENFLKRGGLSATPPPHACKLARKSFSIFLTHL